MPRKHQRTRATLSPARVAGIFVVVAGLWIIMSDALVARVVPHAAEQAAVQTAKGLAFIAITAALIWLLTARLSRQVADARNEEAAALRAASDSLATHAAMVDAMTDALPVGVALITPDAATFLHVNPAFREITGLTEPLPAPEAVLRTLRGTHEQTPEDAWVEAELPRTDGESRRVTLRDIPMADRALRVLMLQDVTERRRHFTALRDSEATLRAIFDQAAVGIAHTTPDGHYLRVNRRYADLLGRSVEELAGLSWQAVTHPDDVAVDKPVTDALSRGARDSAVLEKRYIQPDGTIVWARTTIAGVHDENGTVRYLVGVAEDITARKRMEADLLRSVAELERSNAELERFAHLTSHDLKEPTRSVVSFAQLLARRLEARGVLDPDTRADLDHLISGARRMRRIVDDLLVYARSDTRQERFRAVDLAAALEGTLDALRESIEAEGADIRVLDPLPRVHGLDGQIMQLLGALLGNALKFRHPDRPPVVTLAATRQGDFWRLEVADNGIGFDQSRSAEAFGLFTRLHGPGVTPGSGLGLALARRIVERHGGTISLHSQRGVGTRVTFTLPSGDVAAIAGSATAGAI